jgi:hypothetical protein
MPDPAVACTLTADEINACRDRLLPGLVERAVRLDGLPNGCRLTFAPSSDLLHAIAGTIDRERQCCQFLRFTLTIEPGAAEFVLDVTGPDGTREFLAELSRR